MWELKMDDFMKYDFGIYNVTSLILPGCTKNSYGSKRINYALILYPEGGYTFHFRNGPSLRTTKGSILFMPKGAHYDIEYNDKQDCYSICFEMDKPFPCEPFIFSVKNLQSFLTLFKETDKVFRQAQNGYVMNCKAKVCAIIAAMQREYELGYISGDTSSMLSPAIERIHQCYTENPPTIPELAHLCGVSPEYFRMLFKKKFATSPVKYIKDLRLIRARELLESGVYTISEVATLAGFEELPYFSREFKKKFGISPSFCRSNSKENT